MKRHPMPKRAAVLLAVFALMISGLFPPAAAQDSSPPASDAAPAPAPMLWVEASAPDENGYFDVTVSAESVDFLVCELALRYNTAAVTPVDAETGKPAKDFSSFAHASSYEGLMRIGEKLDSEKGYFLFTLFASPGASGDYVRDSMMHFEGKTELYRFRFKKIAEGDVSLAPASIYDGGVYDEFFPDGAVITSAKEKRLVSGLTIVCDGKTETSQTVRYFYSELYPKNYTKEQRLAGTVYFVRDDYAAAVDGVLRAIDPDNRAVTPVEKDGTLYLPLRFACESLGFSVSWDEPTETAVILSQNAVVGTVDTRTAVALVGETRYEGGIEVVNDRTMVPADLVCALTGARLYDAGTGVILYTGLPEWTPEREAEIKALDAMRYVLMPFFRMFL